MPQLSKDIPDSESLLSTFKNPYGTETPKMTPKVSDNVMSSSGDLPRKRKKQKREPATDDEPLSTTDNESDQLSRSSATPEPKRRATTGWETTLKADLAKIAAESTPKQFKRPPSTPGTVKKKSERRTRSSTITEEARSSQIFTSPSNDSVKEAMVFSKSKEPKNTYSNKPQVPKSSRFEKEETKHEFKVPREAPDIKNTASRPPGTTASLPEFKTPMEIPADLLDSLSGRVTSSHENANDNIFDLDIDESLSSLTSREPSDVGLTAEEKRGMDSKIQRCPSCRELLDPEFLEYNILEEGLSFRKQSEFCQRYKRWTAEREWRQRKYPKIKWKSLHKRLDKHFAELQLILTRKKTSFFRNALESSTEGNTKRDNFRLTADSKLDMMSSGYYGPRGSKTMYALTLAGSLNLAVDLCLGWTPSSRDLRPQCGALRPQIH